MSEIDCHQIFHIVLFRDKILSEYSDSEQLCIKKFIFLSIKHCVAILFPRLCGFIIMILLSSQTDTQLITCKFQSLYNYKKIISLFVYMSRLAHVFTPRVVYNEL